MIFNSRSKRQWCDSFVCLFYEPRWTGDCDHKKTSRNMTVTAGVTAIFSIKWDWELRKEVPGLEMELSEVRPLSRKKGVKSLEKHDDTYVLNETCHYSHIGTRPMKGPRHVHMSSLGLIRDSECQCAFVLIIARCSTRSSTVLKLSTVAQLLEDLLL